MLRLGKKVEYALIALLYMSQKPGHQLSTARELSDRFNISLELMGKILQRLVREKILNSVQGVKGGYYLAHSPDKISMGSVIRAIEGPICLSQCTSDLVSESCERDEICNIKEPLQHIQNKVDTLFNEVSLKFFQTTTGN